MTARTLAGAAESLVGAPFRLHGRDPRTGLDCIGLFAAAMERASMPVSVPSGYPLRVSDLSRWLPDLATCGLGPAALPFAAGDVVLLRPGPGQVHLALAATDGAWIHAHAGHRKVVRSSGLPDGEIIHHWRLIRRD
jgi:cell wall-associated NlpC family hydrolase